MRIILVAGLAALTSLGVTAQEMSRTEVGLQYQMLRINSSRDIPSFTANGGSGSFQYNFTEHFAGVFELGAQHNGNIHNVQLDNTWTTYLLGPRVSLAKRSSRFVPAFECLVGGVNVSGSIKSPLLPDISGARLTADTTAFAMAVGGTLDIRLNHRFTIRPVQLDYLLTRLESRTLLNGSQTFSQNNLRYGAGVVFNFGGTK
jgi:Outer membrane protein beta-barrel domain